MKPLPYSDKPTLTQHNNTRVFFLLKVQIPAPALVDPNCVLCPAVRWWMGFSYVHERNGIRKGNIFVNIQ